MQLYRSLTQRGKKIIQGYFFNFCEIENLMNSSPKKQQIWLKLHWICPKNSPDCQTSPPKKCWYFSNSSWLTAITHWTIVGLSCSFPHEHTALVFTLLQALQYGDSLFSPLGTLCCVVGLLSHLYVNTSHPPGLGGNSSQHFEHSWLGLQLYHNYNF